MSYYCINIFEINKEVLKPYLDKIGMLIPDKIIPVPKEYRKNSGNGKSKTGEQQTYG